MNEQVTALTLKSQLEERDESALTKMVEENTQLSSEVVQCTEQIKILQENVGTLTREKELSEKIAANKQKLNDETLQAAHESVR